MWGAFWGNCIGKQARSLSLQQKCRMLNRCVQPILNFRNTRWPWSAAIADAQDKMQKCMLSQCIALERWHSEPLDSYYKRRMHAISNLAHQQDGWGTQHAIRACNWADHLQRPRNDKSLAAILFNFHDAEWLEERRQDPNIGGALRPGTRAHSVFFHTRWDEALRKARTRLPQQ